MTPVFKDPAVRAYLAELRSALAERPADERELVLDGVRQHIEDATAGAADATHVQRVLDELGDPAAIAAESAPGDEDAAPRPLDPAVPFLERRGGAWLTVLTLVFGGFVVPVLGWIVGVVLLWSSRGWRRIDRLAGTLALPLAVAAVVGARLLWPPRMTTTCDGSTHEGGFCAPVPAGGFPTHLAILTLSLLGLIVAGYLLLRFRPRT